MAGIKDSFRNKPLTDSPPHLLLMAKTCRQQFLLWQKGFQKQT